MKIGTKAAIVLVAIFLSLAGFGVLANSLSADKIIGELTPSTVVGVTING